MTGRGKWIFGCLLFFLAASIFSRTGWGAQEPDIDEKISQEERRMRALESQISKHRELVREMDKKEKGVLNRLSDLDQRKRMTEHKIRILELKETKVQGSITELKRTIRETENRIGDITAMLRERLTAIYKYGGIAEFNLLLSSASAHEAMATSVLLGRIARQDEQMIEELSRRKAILVSSTQELQNQKKQLETHQQSLSGERVRYRASISEHNALLDRVQRERQVHKAAMKELEDAQREISRTITMLMKKKAEEAARAHRRPDSSLLMARGSRFAWPLRGEISSPFGVRVHPTFRTKIMHTGIDIRAPRGTPVAAAGPGEILYSGWLRGYGQVVIIDHGNSLTTVYAHLSSSVVEEGMPVREGQTVGTVGSSGTATGTHLHFEVRVNGDARDPLAYLRR
jgi:murein DD-endopeptidase MepM/ murein hydrolase activator NlpD